MSQDDLSWRYCYLVPFKFCFFVQNGKLKVAQYSCYWVHFQCCSCMFLVFNMFSSECNTPYCFAVIWLNDGAKRFLIGYRVNINFVLLWNIECKYYIRQATRFYIDSQRSLIGEHNAILHCMCWETWCQFFHQCCHQCPPNQCKPSSLREG